MKMINETHGTQGANRMYTGVKRKIKAGICVFKNEKKI